MWWGGAWWKYSIFIIVSHREVDQSAGIIEYTERTSAEE